MGSEDQLDHEWIQRTSLREYKPFESNRGREADRWSRRLTFSIVHLRLAKGAQHYSSHTTGDNDNDALRPPHLPKLRKRASPEVSLDPVTVCARKGPVCSSTYGKLGYELDYKYISKLLSRATPLGQRAMQRLGKKKKQDESKRKGRYLRHRRGKSQKKKKVTADTAWERSRRQRSRYFAFHKVGIEEYVCMRNGKTAGFHVWPWRIRCNISQGEKKGPGRLSFNYNFHQAKVAL